MNLEVSFNKVAKSRHIIFFTRRGKNYDGFTLIEVTVVLFLIGLLFFTAMPNLGNFLFQTDLKSTARSLKASVHYLRSKSITSHRNTAIHFDLDKRAYWGTFEDTPPGGESLHGDASTLIPLKKFPENIRIIDISNINKPKKTFGHFRSIFNPKGVFEETVIHLSDSNDKIMTIIINAYTGRFVLYDEYVDVEYGEE